MQTTSPFRSVNDIDGAIELTGEQNAPACVSLTDAAVSPYWMYGLDINKRMQPILAIEKEKSYQRQKLPSVYQLNGAVYVAEIGFLREEKGFITGETVGFYMPPERSFDIDTMEDFLMADFLMQKLQNTVDNNS